MPYPDSLQPGVLGIGTGIGQLTGTIAGAATLTISGFPTGDYAWILAASGQMVRCSLPLPTTFTISGGTGTSYYWLSLRAMAPSFGYGACTYTLVLSAAQTSIANAANLGAGAGGSSIPASSEIILWDGVVGYSGGDYTLENASASAGWPNNSTGRDRRPWAKGAHWDGSFETGNWSFVGQLANHQIGTLESGSTVVPQVRMECTGHPMRVRMQGFASCSLAGGYYHTYDVIVDGALQNLGTDISSPAASYYMQAEGEYVIYPSAGSHLIGLAWGNGPNNGGQTSVLYAEADAPLLFTVDEILRPTAANGTI
jgi:hypothetical protein